MMKCYTDIDGTIEAEPGDYIALIVTDDGERIAYKLLSTRPLKTERGTILYDDKNGLLEWVL